MHRQSLVAIYTDHAQCQLVAAEHGQPVMSSVTIVPPLPGDNDQGCCMLLTAVALIVVAAVDVLVAVTGLSHRWSQ